LCSLLLLSAAPTFLGAACETWPLFAHLPEEDPGPGEPSRLSVSEDELPELIIQGIGALTAPSVITITGSTQDCGFDLDASWPDWPEHPLDVDGDGVSDTTQPIFRGWFAGETDLYSLASDDAITVGLTLRWDNAPEGDANAPYQPSEGGGIWVEESDLDWVIFSVLDAAPDAIVDDGGFGPAYPQASEQWVRIDPGVPLAVAVACHHEVPTEYSLVLDVRGR
jgi:hypothetical protein